MFYMYVVCGDANFIISATLGGFTQPGTARNLIEIPCNAGKKFSHRFLWAPPLFCKLA